MLLAHQQSVADAVLERESKQRDHLVVALSGAHAYGFPSPDSDLDLKAVHVAPTQAFLGLKEPEKSASFLGVVDGVEIDYTSNEIGPVLAGVLQGNGNYMERFLGALILRTSPEHDALRELVQAALSRRLAHHYAGFARNQLDAVRAAAMPSAKSVLYVLRTALTGTHALLHGKVVADLSQLLDDYGFAEAHTLIVAKRAGERIELGAREKAHWLGTLEQAMERLRHAREHSPLPEEAPNRSALEAWLIDMRRQRLHA